MPSEIFQPYRHSGKFGPFGPVLVLGAVLALGFPLGFAYGFVMKWIPFILLRVFGTAAYGFGLGLLTMQMLKLGKVRSNPIAGLCGALAGCIGLYFSWNGHLHTLFKDAPLLCSPGLMLTCMQQLYENGSWALRDGENVSGIALAGVWVVEGLMVIGLSALVPAGAIADTPFCEQSQCWLDDEKKIETLELFAEPDQQSALKRGDLGPLLQARPRPAGSASFARLVLKRSSRCAVFCTVRIENVERKPGRRGEQTETIRRLTENLVLPQSMFALIQKFENFNAAEPAAQAA